MGEGDTVAYDTQFRGVLMMDGSILRLDDVWVKQFQVQSGEISLGFKLKEIDSLEEFEGYQRLMKLHYRGSMIAGRRVPLVAVSDLPELPRITAFVELATTFLVNTARRRVLNAPFEDDENNVAWVRWDQKTAKKWVNSIARISRCVVYPELRGLGIASQICHLSADFARNHWQIKGVNPSFLEITADMLRYWPFVKDSGFVFVGETEGNAHRAAKDMDYLVKRSAAVEGNGIEGMPKGGGGILSHQRSNAVRVNDIVRSGGMSSNSITEVLRTDPSKLTDEQWLLLHKVYRRPKPTYMMGLTESAQKFITKRVSIVLPPIRHHDKGIRDTSPLHKLASIRDLKITARSKISPSNRSRDVQEAFGIVVAEEVVEVIRSLDIDVYQGDIVLISGPSGSGKSLLMGAIRRLTSSGPTRYRMPKGVFVKGKNSSTDIEIVTAKLPPSNATPIDSFGHLSIEQTLQTLGSSGLGDPRLYLRPVSTLSDGQKHRLGMACAFSLGGEIVMFDGFCESIDILTAAALCRKIMERVKVEKTPVIMATIAPERIRRLLEPTLEICLSSDGYATVTRRSP
ncbi:ATP-binding cassette domain-containing protein [SAR202 cluster bacterium AD-812-D07_MRT_10900m]|nr:ATP-binding cassette domain-containing protein [SAR202 cluster bacterium AD-812-D07_MRT_10900m]